MKLFYLTCCFIAVIGFGNSFLFPHVEPDTSHQQYGRKKGSRTPPLRPVTVPPLDQCFTYITHHPLNNQSPQQPAVSEDQLTDIANKLGLPDQLVQIYSMSGGVHNPISQYDTIVPGFYLMSLQDAIKRFTYMSRRRRISRDTRLANQEHGKHEDEISKIPNVIIRQTDTRDTRLANQDPGPHEDEISRIPDIIIRQGYKRTPVKTKYTRQTGRPDIARQEGNEMTGNKGWTNEGEISRIPDIIIRQADSSVNTKYNKQKKTQDQARKERNGKTRISDIVIENSVALKPRNVFPFMTSGKGDYVYVNRLTGKVIVRYVGKPREVYGDIREYLCDHAYNYYTNQYFRDNKGKLSSKVNSKQNGGMRRIPSKNKLKMGSKS